MEEDSVKEPRTKEDRIKERIEEVKGFLKDVDANGALVCAYAIVAIDVCGDISHSFAYDSHTDILGILNSLKIRIEDSVREDWAIIDKERDEGDADADNYL